MTTLRCSHVEKTSNKTVLFGMLRFYIDKEPEYQDQGFEI